MANGKKNKNREHDIATLGINGDLHPAAIEGINEFAHLMKRRPHEAVRIFFSETQNQMPEILKFIRDDLKIIF